MNSEQKLKKKKFFPEILKDFNFQAFSPKNSSLFREINLNDIPYLGTKIQSFSNIFFFKINILREKSKTSKTFLLFKIFFNFFFRKVL